MLEGLPPNGATHVMRVACEEAMARGIADIVVESFDPATTAASAFQERPGASTCRNGGPWIVEAYFGTPPDEAKVRALIAAVAGDAAALQAVFDRIVARDWVKSSLVGLQPVRVGRFLIHVVHGRDGIKPNDIGIEIEAALAFGTGHHGSTRGCLILLNQLARKRRPRAILDLGTGSGILAIAAAKLFKRDVHAGDIDPVCVNAARANAKRNGAGAYVQLVLANGAAHPLLRQGAPYDVVMANILARPLRNLAPEIARLTKPGADIILSGLTARDDQSVIAAYLAQAIFLARRIDVEGWATLLMQRG
jgi:ribosomal protein L11 methyltransferase